MSIPPDVMLKIAELPIPLDVLSRLIAILEPAFGEFSLVGGDGRPDDWPADSWERFWEKYPSKIGKADARKAFLRARKTKVPWEQFWRGLQRYISKRDDRRWCNPSTWLNQQRWDDGAPPARQLFSGSGTEGVV